MAYPCGEINNDARTAALICDHTGIRYAGTITSRGSFHSLANLFRLDPTVQITDLSRANALADRFLDLPASQPAIFYIWEHGYEFDLFDSWYSFELFCKKVAGHEDIAYCTNREALLGKRRLKMNIQRSPNIPTVRAAVALPCYILRIIFKHPNRTAHLSRFPTGRNREAVHAPDNLSEYFQTRAAQSAAPAGRGADVPHP